MKSTISNKIWDQIINIANQGKQFVESMPIKVKTVINPRTLGGALQEAINTFNPTSLLPNKQSRIQKGAYPIANKADGTLLFSDGSVRDTEKSLRYKQQLKTLRENVINQYAFTPQAAAYLRTIPLSVGSIPGSVGTYYNRESAEPINRSYMSGYRPKLKPSRIGINPQVLSWSGTTPAEVMTHEMLHALDANINANAEASYLPRGKYSADSFGFYPQTQSKESQKVKKQIEEFLARYPQSTKNPYMQDVESFAQYGTTRDEALLSPQGGWYNRIFTPINKNINFSPIYPTNRYFNSAMNQLFSGQQKLKIKHKKS